MCQKYYYNYKILDNIVVLLTLGKSIFAWQNFLRRNWMPEQVSGQLIHVTGTPPWLLRPVKVSTSSELKYFRCLS